MKSQGIQFDNATYTFNLIKYCLKSKSVELDDLDIISADFVKFNRCFLVCEPYAGLSPKGTG